MSGKLSGDHSFADDKVPDVAVLCSEPTQEQVVVFVQKDYFEDQSLPHQLAKLNVNLQGLRESAPTTFSR